MLGREILSNFEEDTVENMKTLAIVEDQPVVRDITVEIIQKIQFHDNIISLNKIEQIVDLNHEPNILVVDLNLPGDHQSDLRSHIKKFRKKYKNTKIVIFSGFMERLPLGLVKEANINGLIAKELETNKIATGFSQILGGEEFYCEISLKSMDTRGELGENSKSIVDIISKREFQIFRLLLDHHSEEDIAQKLDLSRKTVSNHKHTIMKKLDIHSHAELINLGRKNGY